MDNKKCSIAVRALLIYMIVVLVLAGVKAQDDGLVAEWHFDEGVGNVVKDSSGNGNDGTIYGATWVDGKFGKALSFDGVDDYVKINYDAINPLFNLNTEFTYEIWVNPSKSGFIIAREQCNNAWPSAEMSISGSAPKLDIQFYLNYQNANTYKNFKITQIISQNSWSHIIATYNKETQKFVIYYNNNNVLSDNFVQTIWKPSTPLWIGGIPKPSSDCWENYFNGIIDEVRIYNRALSAEEVKEHYESGQMALSITKTTSPQSIKQGQNTTITLTVKNTGSAELKDIEIADTVPSYLTFLNGETSKRYDSLAPQDSRQISYKLQLNDAGTFNLEPAVASYADNKGNYNTVKSKSASVEVIRSVIENPVPTPKPTNGNVQSASVNLHGEKTDVTLGENVLLKLSAINIIGNPIMHVQVIIIPPNGWSVTSSEFSKSGAGQYTTMYDLKPEDGSRDIEVRIMPNQIGDNFEVKGRIIYYFGEDLSTREDHPLSLPIKVRAESKDPQNPDVQPPKSPGFEIIFAGIGMFLALSFRRR